MAKLMTNRQGEEFAKICRRHGVTCADATAAFKNKRMDTFAKSLLSGENAPVLVRVEWVRCLSDAEALEKYPGKADLLVRYRKMASVFDPSYTGPVVAEVMAGFQWKEHAAKYGPCHNNWAREREWRIGHYEATIKCLAFWVPRLVPGSTSKSISKQNGLLATLREEYKLPAHHLTSCGAMSLLVGLVLGHFNATRERVPLDCFYVGSDSFDYDFFRLGVGCFDGRGLRANRYRSYYYDGDGSTNLGCFALGIEPIT